MDYKICTKCGEEFPATSEFFHKSKTGKFGIRSICNSCRRKQSIENKGKYDQYYRDNKEKFLELGRKYREDHKEYRKQRREEKKEEKAVYDKKYRKNNRDKYNAHNANYRVKKLNQTPTLTEAQERQIGLLYKKCHELGMYWNIDHIIPISKGGLHHPNNLQIVTKSYNLQKHNSLDFRPPTEMEIYKVKEMIL